MVQRRAARYAYNRYHNTSSVSNMLNTLNWPQLTKRRLHARLVMMYKITHHLVAIPSSTILIPSDSRTRKHHSQTFRHIYTPKDSYRFSFFPYTITHWNLLPTTVVTTQTVDSFREQLTYNVTCFSTDCRHSNGNQLRPFSCRLVSLLL